MYQVLIDEEVLKHDFRSIAQPDQRKILKTIHKKLRIDPEAFGKPLTGELKGYWRLRVGQFRVIYKILKDKIQVVVVLVDFRRNDDVYEHAKNRLFSH